MKKVQTQINKLETALQQARSVRGALFRLREILQPFGAEHLTYVMMLHPTAYKRGDQVASSTFPMDMWQFYWQSGGMLTDALMEVAPFMAGPTSINLEMVTEQYRTGSAPHKYFTAIVKNGWPLVMGYPIFMNDGTLGISGLGVVCSAQSRLKLREAEFYMQMGRVLQRCFRRYGYFRRYYDLTDKEVYVLEKMARGLTAAEIAEVLNLQTRTIEMRLQTARKKLRAMTTTEAVFKATAFSIIGL
jgi:DNA-binding CsgD family transcriptional regulator